MPPKQINFAGISSNELYEEIVGYEEVPYSDIEPEDEILVLTYLSSSSEDGSNESARTT